MDKIPDMPRRANLPWSVKLLVTVLAIAFGFYGSIFGPVYMWILGGLVALGGFLSQTSRRPVLLLLGAGIVLGGVLYIAVGVLTPDGNPSQSGCSTSTGEPCQAVAPSFLR